MGLRPTRLGLLAVLIAAVAAIISLRLVQLQAIHGSKYENLSRGNALRKIRVPAPRGQVVDRVGRSLIENQANFVFTVNLSQIKDLNRALHTLEFLLDLPKEDLREQLVKHRKYPKFTPIPVLTQMVPDQIDAIRGRMVRIQTENLSEYSLEGLNLELRYERVYPYRNILGHLLGYTREVGPKAMAQWEVREPGRVGLGTKIGFKGIEKRFEDQLRGYDGFHYAVVDSLGRAVDLEALGLEDWFQDQGAKPGETLQLSIDAELTQVAHEAFGDRVGALVAMNPQNGEILAWVSQPSFTPDLLSGRVPQSLWESLRDHPEHILLNRPTQAAYPPGSTHKIVTALAGLAEGKIDFKEKITCHGHYLAGGRKWGCWNRSGHGALNLTQALKYSCDVFFYRLGERLGPDKLADYAQRLGLGAKTEILSDYERPGLIPTSAWKELKRGEAWRRTDNLGNAIGQGFNLVTPLQNALMMARFANGKTAVQATLLKDAPGSEPGPLQLGLDSEAYEKLKEALVQVVEGPGGTGGRARLEKVHVGGKTGTAQVVSLERKGGRKTEDHAWFVAFAPAESPEIAVAVLVEHGGGGGAVAAPIAKKVLEHYFAGSPVQTADTDK